MGIFIAFVRKEHSVIVSYLLAKKKENEKNMNVYVISIAFRFFLKIRGYMDCVLEINVMIDCIMYGAKKSSIETLPNRCPMTRIKIKAFYLKKKKKRVNTTYTQQH